MGKWREEKFHCSRWRFWYWNSVMLAGFWVWWGWGGRKGKDCHQSFNISLITQIWHQVQRLEEEEKLVSLYLLGSRRTSLKFYGFSESFLNHLFITVKLHSGRIYCGAETEGFILGLWGPPLRGQSFRRGGACPRQVSLTWGAVQQWQIISQEAWWAIPLGAEL